MQHAGFVVGRGIAERNAHQEAVELGLGQKIGAFKFKGILRRHDHERLRELARLAIDGHLRLVHRFEQRRLCARRGAVDLVRHDDVGKDRPLLEDELAALLIPDRHPEHVRRQHVGGQLDARERAIEAARQAGGEHGLADAGHIFNEHVAAREQTDQQLVDRLLMAEVTGLDVRAKTFEPVHRHSLAVAVMKAMRNVMKTMNGSAKLFRKSRWLIYHIRSE